MHLHYNFACIHKTLRVTPAIEAGVADLTALVFIIYVMLTLTMGISALSKGAIYPGIAGIVGPILCWFATGGLKGSFLARPSPQKFARLGAAVTFVALVAVGIGIVYHSGYWVGLFGYGFTGVTWCLVGLVAGWIATPREHADPRSKETLAAGAQERVISKADVDMIFAFARADWERYVHQVGPPEGWTVRLLPLETGTTLARFNQSTGMGASIQPLYTDDQSVPRMIVVGSHYPLGFMRITNEVIK